MSCLCRLASCARMSVDGKLLEDRPSVSRTRLSKVLYFQRDWEGRYHFWEDETMLMINT